MLKLQNELESGSEAEQEPSKVFDSSSIEAPFETGEPSGDDRDFPGEVKTAWLTFHESTTHEEFIVGLRPQPTDGGVSLEPRAGILLSLAEHARNGNTSVIFIDEINRANVSKVFGQFITLMEPDKRLDTDGDQQQSTVGITFQQLDDGDEVKNPWGDDFTIEFPFHLPQNLYLVASMNSLDRSTAPLDSALARRFDQVSVEPDYTALADHLGTDAVTGVELSPDPQSVSPEKIAIALLWRTNQFLRSVYGDDFQLGPGYVWSVGEADSDTEAIEELAVAWDSRILPKLREVFRSREDQLATLLKADESLNGMNNPYHRDEIPAEWGKVGADGPLQLPDLRNLDTADQRTVLHGLARSD
ncbi:AAA family ATPase [Halorussus limi]|uniref:AAA family ATPase n=3 Tax=Haladaptataceae TaxID=3064797 RepID=A0A8U0INE0_9EURY|nr:AAA family ATPase [Halorussus limi]UPW01694.1 AAA family ATPase [Halorussus gelatinilyticus]